MPTPNLALEPLAAAQAQKHVTLNEALARLDAAAQLAVITRGLADPPTDPQDGARYLIAVSPTDAWAEHAGDIAAWEEASQGWLFLTPRPGWRLWVTDEDSLLIYTDGGWAPVQTGATDPPIFADQFGVNTSADAINRLAVKSDAILFSHDDVTPGTGDLRLVLNRASEANTGSLVFQDNFSGRAELGLSGPDRFAIRTSPDGAGFIDAVTIDNATGIVSFPKGIRVTDGASIEQIAEGFVAIERARSDARSGNLARTTSIVMEALEGVGTNVVLASADDENILTIDGTYARTLARGEVYAGEHAAGAIIETERGHVGASRVPGGPMPLGLAGFAGRQFFFFAFRASAGTGYVTAAAGAVAARVELRDGSGAVIEDGPHTIPPFGQIRLTTPRDTEEYQVVADQDVFVSVRGNLFDQRLVPPPATRLIGHARSAQISALFPDTLVTWHTQSGLSGSFSTGPGSPVNFQTQTGVTGASGYSPSGYLILRASGPISAFSGADGAGSNATPFFPLDSLGQRAALPFESEGGLSAAAASLSIASPFEGTARIFAADGTLLSTLALSRGTTPPVSPSDQRAPAAAQFVPPAGVSIGPGGWVDADVPIFVVQNAAGAANAFPVSGDEVALPTITLEESRAELRLDEAGLIRRRKIDTTGAESWVLS